MSTLKASPPPLASGTAKVSCFAARRVADRDMVYTVSSLNTEFTGYNDGPVTGEVVLAFELWAREARVCF